MNCVFDIKLNAPMNAFECIKYKGVWCEFCDEDNGGGKFCYNCGQRKTDDEEVEVEDEEVEDEDDEVEDEDDEEWLTYNEDDDLMTDNEDEDSLY